MTYLFLHLTLKPPKSSQKLYAYVEKIWHAFDNQVGLLLWSKDNLPTITLLGSRVRAISTLPIPLTVRSIKSFIGCVIYLEQFLPKLSELIKPINDILKKCNKVDPADKISPLPLYAKGKGKEWKLSPDIQKYWKPIHTTDFEAIKSLIVKAPILHLPACTARFYVECDSSLNKLVQCYTRDKVALKMLLPFTVPQCQMPHIGTQAQSLNNVVWKYHSFIFNICWNIQLLLSWLTTVP